MNNRVFTLIAGAVICALFALPIFAQSNAEHKNSRPTVKPRTNIDLAQDDALMQAIEMNVAEIAVGKIASAKANDGRVKSYADRMVKDHTEALAKLRLLPDASPAVKPNVKHQETAERLSKLSGPEFDREYINAMVNDHQEAVAFLERQAGETGQAKTVGALSAQDSKPNGLSLAEVAEELLPMVRQHLQQAQDLQKAMAEPPTAN